MIHNFDKTQSIINQYIAEMRDHTIQQDSLRFRTNMERIGALIGFEISKLLEYEAKDTQTPLGISKSMILKDKIVLATILRAGLPLNNGFLNVFDKAESGFVTAYRKSVCFVNMQAFFWYPANIFLNKPYHRILHKYSS